MKKAFAVLVVGVAGSAVAQPASVSFDINAEDFGDSSGNVFSIDFALGEVASIDSVSIELAHSWSNDLDFILTGPDGSIFDLTSDNGVSVNLGDGGESLAGVATYTFVEAAGNGSWADFGFDEDAPGGTYDAESWASGPFAAGSWNISLDDDANGDDGAVGSVVINYTLVPAPASVALLAGAGLVARRRR